MAEREARGELDRECEVSVVTEQMGDGRWAVAVTVVHVTEGARQAIPLPMTHERFDSEAEARAYGLQRGREWVEHNASTIVRP